MNHKKIQRIMRKYDLRVKVRRRNPYRKMMKKSLEHRVCSNVLQRQFNQTIPKRVLCTDITYIPFHHNFVYLSVIKDVASGEVVAWNLSRNLSMKLVTETFRFIDQDLYTKSIIHSDQGFHYTNPEYINLVKSLGMIQSMSAKGKCIDNAPIESFFGHMKDELDYKSCQTFRELDSKIDEYMRYYNNERKQWTRRKMTPVEYRKYLIAHRFTG